MNDKESKKGATRKRANQIIIRLTDEELNELNEAIEASGTKSKTDFFLKIIRQGKIIIVNDLREVYAELKKQGTNLNQALKYYHETNYADEIKQAIKNCNEVYKTTKNIILQTENKIKEGQKRKVPGQQKKINNPSEVKEISVVKTPEEEKPNVEEIKVSDSISITLAKQIELYQSQKDTKAGDE